MKSRLVGAAVLALLAAPLAAQQQPICGERAALVAQLEKKYGESRQALGLQGNSVILEVYASADTGTWTILFTRPDGVACAMAAGEAWREENGASRRDPPA